MKELLRKVADSVLIAPEGHAIGLMIGDQQVYFERTFTVPCVIKHKLIYIECTGYPVKDIIDKVQFAHEPKLVQLLKELHNETTS